MFQTGSESKQSDDLEKVANSIVYTVMRRIFECSKYRSVSGMCSPSSPSLLCSLSEDSVSSKSLPLIRNPPEEGNRYPLGFCMDDVMSKLLHTKPDDPNQINLINDGKIQSDRVPTDDYNTPSCSSREVNEMNKLENEFDKTDNMASASNKKADDNLDDSRKRNRTFPLRRSFSDSTLTQIKNRDFFAPEVSDEEIRENLRSLKLDLEKLFSESEVIVSKCVGHFWSFLRKIEDESIANNSQLSISMSERLPSINEFTNTITNEIKDYNDMVKNIVVSTYRIAKESSAAEINNLQMKVNKKDIILNHFREENMRITHAMMEKEQDWAMLKSKLYAEILCLTKETAKPWKELFSAGPKYGLVSLPWKRLKSLFEIYHNQEKMMSLVLDRDRKINELKLLIYQQQMMNCSLQEKLLLLNSSVQEQNNVNSGDSNFALKSELSRVSDTLHMCTSSSVPYVSADPDEAIMEIFNLKGEEDLASQDSYIDYYHTIDNCTDACSAPAVHDLMARFQETTSE